MKRPLLQRYFNRVSLLKWRKIKAYKLFEDLGTPLYEMPFPISYLSGIQFEVIIDIPKLTKVKFKLRGDLSSPQKIAYNKDFIGFTKFFFDVHKFEHPDQKDFIHWSDTGH